MWRIKQRSNTGYLSLNIALPPLFLEEEFGQDDNNAVAVVDTSDKVSALYGSSDFGVEGEEEDTISPSPQVTLSPHHKPLPPTTNT